MLPNQVLDLAHRIWPLPWEIDPNATDPAVVSAEAGALVVVIALTRPLTVVGMLGDETEFFEAETENLAMTLVELEATFRQLVEVPGLTM